MVRYLMWLGEWLMSFYLNGGNLSWFIVSNLNGMNWGMQKYLWVSLGIVNGHTENWKLPTATAHSSPKCPSSYLGKTRCKWTLVDEAGWNDAPESSEHVEHDPIHCCEAPLISAVFVGIILISSGRNRVIFGWNRVFFQISRLVMKTYENSCASRSFDQPSRNFNVKHEKLQDVRW